MSGTCSHAGADPLQNLTYLPPVVEKRNVLLPRQADHYPQSILLRNIQKPARRYRVSSNGIHSIGCHPSKVVSDHAWAVFIALIIRTKWSVRYTANVKLLPAGEDKLSPYGWPRICVRELRRFRPDCCTGAEGQDDNVSFQTFFP